MTQISYRIDQQRTCLRLLLFMALFGLYSPAYGQLTFTITPDNPAPTPSCGDDNVTYTVQVCNPGEGFVYFDLTINSPLANQTVTAYSDPLELTPIGSTVEQLSVQHYKLAPGDCAPFTFTAKVTNLGAGGFVVPAQVVVTQPVAAVLNAQATIANAPVVILPAGTSTLTQLIPGIFPANGCDGVIRKFQVPANSTLLVNTGYCLSNGVFIMEAGSAIRVTNLSAFNINLCRFVGCEKMWKGVTAEAGAAIEARRSFFADAQYAIQIETNASAQCLGNTFDRNYVGFYASWAGSLLPNPVLMLGNTFTCSDALKEAFDGQSPAPAAKGWAGIEVHSFPYLPVTNWDHSEGYYQARFEKMFNGIIATECATMTVSKCIFENITAGFDEFWNQIGGKGIDHINGRGLMVEGFGGGSFATPSFNTITDAIHAVNINTTQIWDNYMLNVQDGIQQEFIPEYGVASIHNNSIQAAWTGIWSYQGRPTDGQIFKNKVYMTTPAIGFGAPYVAAGIHLVDYTTPADMTSWDVYDNIIYLDAAITGITIFLTANVKTHNNTIYHTNPQFNRAGVGISVSDQNQIFENTVYGVNSSIPPNSSYNGSIGLFINRCASTTIYCNKLHNSNIGTQFMFTNTGTDFKGNEFLGGQDVGLVLGTLDPSPPLYELNAVIGDQLYKGNLWKGSFASFGAKNTSDAALVGESTFFVNPNVPFSEPPGVSAAAIWFISTPQGRTYTCGESGHLGESPNDLDYSIATNASLAGTFDWNLQRQLLQRLDAHPEWLSAPAFDAFSSTAQTETARAFHHLSKSIAATGGVNPTTSQYIAGLRAQLLDAQAACAQASAELYSGTLTGQSYLDARAEYNTACQALQDVHAQLDVFYTAYTANRAAVASALLPVVENLPENTAYEANEKAVDRIFLQLLAAPGSLLSPAQQQTLAAIAAQCPGAGGNAVYAARAILIPYTGLKRYDDTQACAGVERGQMSAEYPLANDLNVWPNPASDQIVLGAERVFTQVELVNCFGQTVYSQRFEPLSRVVLPLPGVAAGSYVLRVAYADGGKGVRKVVVVR